MSLASTDFVKQFYKSETTLSPVNTYPDPGGWSVSVRYTQVTGSNSVSYATNLSKKYKIKPDSSVQALYGSFHATVGSEHIVDRSGILFKGVGGNTEVPVQVGTINYADREITLTDASIESDIQNVPMVITHCTAVGDTEPTCGIVFRAPGSDITPGSLSVRATLPDGSNITGVTDFSGNITGAGIKGFIDQSTGVCRVDFGTYITDDAQAQAQDWYDVENIDGANIWKPYSVDAATILINCVVTSYLPLDAGLLGLDPVRLPMDGRVPIFRKGQVITIHNTQTYTAPSPLSASQVFNVGRTALSLIELYDQNDVYVPELGYYSVNLDTGDVTMESPLDLSGYTEPLKAIHRIEDQRLASDVQITGHIAVTYPITHNYLSGETYVSSTMPLGDKQARITKMFEQDGWTGVWSDVLIGDAPLASYDFLNFPIQVTNKSATQERFAILFVSSTAFQIVGENLGVIGTGTVASDIAINNPATGEPYFTMLSGGWGSGWSVGDVVRFNSNGANFPIWFIRTTLQGPPTEFTDDFTLQIRGGTS